ncbi:hypothetical protein EDC94DRAFT_616202 [Helicostylum pulchrum]|nr:hypothetical protein EDC94DRAFT_616202 [Helicostylum pulchrum]
MFFEATYVPSPPLSVASIDDRDEIPTDTPEPNIEPASDKPVDHLIFVIHGIGQQTEQYGHFYEHIENLQETTRQVLQAKVPDHNVRIELIPIEWHRHIHEQVDPTINKITLKSIPTIRLIQNDYLADVLFYFSKDRGQNIVNNVTNLFNTSYHNFKEKHPNFDGKIIILGYSLGGVIVWDILSHQREPANEKERDHYKKLDINFSKLDFKPHFFYGLGSPLGAVLTFRGQDPTLYHPDFDIQFENVFHPFDPIGYRFEPLFNDYFTDKPAVLIERSAPFGPSFSFPSMPSFPLSSGFLSFFSWKTEDKAAKTIFNATAEAAEANMEPDQSTEADADNSTESTPATSPTEQQQTGFMSSLMGYFSKGGGTKKQARKDNEDESKDIGIITWDPLREQTREQLLALRDDLDRTLNNTSMNNMLQAKRPSMKIRSKTYAATANEESLLYSSSLEQNSDGSVMSKAATAAVMSTSKSLVSSSNSSTKDDTAINERIPLRKTMTENPKRQHLVEVLGIDGVRVDSFERARENFDKHERKSNEQEGKEDDETKELNGSGGDNLWSDLNKELNKPGPAITSPGESRADVAQDATVPQSSNGGTDKKETDLEQEEINQLPGKCRMDYVLQPDSVMSMIANEYLIGLRAHFSYWTNKDLLWHMLRRIENLNGKPVSDEFKNVTPITSTTANASTTSVVSIDDRNIVKKNK